jgi:radical SAM protein with 4Fe4S-binding SPASM domain
MQNITLYVKPTEKCNLSCLHCYNNVDGLDSGSLSFKTLKTFLERFTEYFKDKDLKHVNVVLHGGEPTLVGPDYLQNMMILLKEYLSIFDTKYSIQTNLVKLDENLLSFFKAYFESIGTSYSPYIRFVGKDEKYYQPWIDNLRKLKDENFMVHLVINLTKKYILNHEPNELIEFLLTNKIDSFHLEPTTYSGLAQKNWNDLYTDPTLYDEWKTNFTKLFINNKVYKTIHSSEISLKAKTFLDSVFVGCSSRDCMLKTITLNADGTLGSCPNISKILPISNSSKPFSDFIDSEKRIDLIVKERSKRTECIDCKFYKYCNGGCCQTEYCFEGKKFFDALMNYVKYDDEFRQFITELKR